MEVKPAYTAVDEDPKNKSTLFKFVSLRSPDLISSSALKWDLLNIQILLKVIF